MPFPDENIMIPEKEKEIHAGQVRQVYQHHSVGLIANVAISSILVFVQWRAIPHPVLIVWFLSLLLATLAKYLLLLKYRSRKPDPARSYRWGDYFVAGAVVTGLLWGSAGIFLFPEKSLGQQIFTVFVLGGMVAGAAGTFSALRGAFLAFSLPALIPVTVKFFTIADDIHIAMGTMIILFLILMIVTSRRTFATIRASLELALENKNLVQHLTKQKAQSESLNIKLVAEIKEKKKAEEKLKLHQKQLEELIRERTSELKDSEEKYRALVNHANDAIFIAQDGVIKFPNPMLTEISGYSAEDVASTSFMNLVHPQDRELVMARHRRRLKGEEVPSIYSFRIITKNGQEKWVDINAVLIEWEGRPATLNFVRDVTEKRKLEKRILASRKMEAIGTLAGGIAHDFNNLLMSIQGNISLLLKKINPGGPGYNMLKNIEDYIRNGTELTRQLLGFARGGKYEIKPTDLNEIVKKTLTMFGRTKKEIRIHKKFEENLPAAEVDRGQIEQVLLNLYINAAQAMPDGGDLRLETEKIDFDEGMAATHGVEPGEYVKIAVTDTGIGMNKEIQQRIFDPFFTTRKLSRGTGLGLASVYGIIKNHGGVITIYSEVGEGTVFNIYLPVSEKPVKIEKPSAGTMLKSSGMVLLVDDEGVVLQTIAKYLELMGFEVLTAGDGEKAIGIYRQNKDRVKFVLLDMIMPGFSGRKTYQELKKINPEVIVLLSSGYSLDGEAGEMLQKGCNGFIQKPFTIEQLSEKLAEIVGKESSA